jgi:hypothetical protein
MAKPLDQLLARASQPIFLPLAFSVARQMEGIDWPEAAEEPALMAHALKQARTLLKADGLVCWFDSWLEVEAAGVRPQRPQTTSAELAPPPLGAAIAQDAFTASPAGKSAIAIARNLAQETAVLAAITGPKTLLVRLGAEAAPQSHIALSALSASLALARAYFEAGVSALLLIEEHGVDRSCLQAGGEIFRLASYFSTPVILLSRAGLDRDCVESARDAGLWPAGASGETRLRLVPERAFSSGAWEQASTVRSERTVLMSEWDLAATLDLEQAVAFAGRLRE